ncbi:MAG: hemerythrin domain-containing protein [Burkholderiales bacterium]|nr:hemerythrin domain-containing protein [Burkholderiales bacterium]MDE2453801.1 hemerythrin domain-containing protein [Burkholderiales bacterium]
MSATASPKVRPARAPVPALPPFEALDRTHREVMQVLGRFERLLAHIDESGADAVARASAAEIAAFFNGHAREHHAEEERLVFPGLLASGNAPLVQHVLRLQQDHGWLEEDWLELEPQIDAIARGYNWYDLNMLRAALPIFTALYQDHIALEESLIYPEAKRRQAELDAGARQRAS